MRNVTKIAVRGLYRMFRDPPFGSACLGVTVPLLRAPKPFEDIVHCVVPQSMRLVLRSAA